MLRREAEAALRKGAAREAEALRASSEHLRTSLEAEQLARRGSEKELGASQTRWDKTSVVLYPQTAGQMELPSRLSRFMANFDTPRSGNLERFVSRLFGLLVCKGFVSWRRS